MCKTGCIHHWHRILDRRHADVIKVMNSKKLVFGRNIKPSDKIDSYEVCPVGKLFRPPFPSKTGVSSESILELVNTMDQ